MAQRRAIIYLATGFEKEISKQLNKKIFRQNLYYFLLQLTKAIMSTNNGREILACRREVLSREQREGATFLIDWHLPNQPFRITSVACFSSMQIFHAWEKCRLADLKNSFYLLIKMHLVSGQQLAEGLNSAIHSLSVNKANPEKIWTTTWIFWISLAHIKAYFPTIRP